MATTVLTAGKNLSASALAAAITHIAIEDSGGNELTATGYSRQAVTWGAANAGTVAMTGTLTYSVTSSAAFYKAAGYSASSSGTRYAVKDLSSTASFGSAGGTYTISALTLTLSDPA